jgi:hypothetical protein
MFRRGVLQGGVVAAISFEVAGWNCDRRFRIPFWVGAHGKFRRVGGIAFLYYMGNRLWARDFLARWIADCASRSSGMECLSRGLIVCYNPDPAKCSSSSTAWSTTWSGHPVRLATERERSLRPPACSTAMIPTRDHRCSRRPTAGAHWVLVLGLAAAASTACECSAPLGSSHTWELLSPELRRALVAERLVWPLFVVEADPLPNGPARLCKATEAA